MSGKTHGIQIYHMNCHLSSERKRLAKCPWSAFSDSHPNGRAGGFKDLGTVISEAGNECSGSGRRMYISC